MLLLYVHSSTVRGLSLLAVGLILISPLYPQLPATPARAADVLVMLTIKPDIERERVMKVMPDEIRATVRLYLDGKIRQWYSRADGMGVVFVLDCKDVAEATSVMEALPLAKERLVNLEFTALTPLTPLRLLLDGQPGRP
jgi:hypothetical protein